MKSEKDIFNTVKLRTRFIYDDDKSERISKRAVEFYKMMDSEVSNKDFINHIRRSKL